MLKNKNNRIIALFLAVMMLGLVVGGCGSSNTAPANSDSSGDNAASAKPDKVYKMTMPTTWPESISLYKMGERFGDILNATTNGRMQVEVHPSGALMGAAEVLDAASSGTVEAYHDFAGYWIGKMPGAPFFAAVPMIMEPDMYLAWIYEGGGLELWQKMYDEAGYNVKVFPVGITHPELLAQANKPMKNLEDWKGLKYRTVGWWGEILREIGVSVTSLPGGEVYPSLERGILDAAEFSTPMNNQVLGFDEVTEYISGPGMHQPATLFSVGINKDFWNELPDDLKRSVEEAARAATLWSWMYDLDKSIDALEKSKADGMKMVTASEEVQKELYDVTVELLDKKAAEQGGIFAEIWKSMKDYRDTFIEYEDFMMPIRVRD